MRIAPDVMALDAQGHLHVGRPAHAVRTADGRLLSPLSDVACSDVWPVFCLAHGETRWLCFVTRAPNSGVTVWPLSPEGRALAQQHWPRVLWHTVLRWAGCAEGLEAAFWPALAGLDPPTWVEARSRELFLDLDLTRTGGCLGTCTEGSDWLRDALADNVPRMNADLPGLLAWLTKDSTVAGYTATIYALWQSLSARLLGHPEPSTPFFDDLRSQAAYQLLREAVAAVTGRHLLRCPFSGTYLFATATRYIDHRAGHSQRTGGGRVIRYDPWPGFWYHEIRGHGFLAETNALVTADGLVLQVPLEQAWSSWFMPEAAARYPLLSVQAGPLGPHEVVVLNTCAGPNLGHLLWNDCSGLATVMAIENEATSVERARPWRVILPPLRDQRFATAGHEILITRALQRAVPQESSDAGGVERPMLQNFEDSESLERYLALPHRVVVSFKSMVMNPVLAGALRAEFTEIPLPPAGAALAIASGDYLRVFVNVRIHDKSLLNLEECLLTALGYAAEQGLSVSRLHFVLEGTEDAREILSALALALREAGAQALTVAGLGLAELGAVIARCDAAIVPIGSGAVLPTWIYDLPTLLHADRAHMPQAGFWPHVGGSAENLVVIDSTGIMDEEDRLYSSYRVIPEFFAHGFSQLMARTRQRRARYQAPT
jgi:hypothetical protein